MPITTAGTAWFLALADDTDAADVCALAMVLAQLPGVKEARAHRTSSDRHVKVIVYGTDRGKRLALEVAKIAKVYEPDHNADHDHAACVESARKMGVPAAYAHTPETYLSM